VQAAGIGGSTASGAEFVSASPSPPPQSFNPTGNGVAPAASKTDGGALQEFAREA
jgi:hypothetical protein